MVTHSIILAWEILWTEKPGGPQSMGSQELDTTEPLTSMHHSELPSVLISTLVLEACSSLCLEHSPCPSHTPFLSLWRCFLVPAELGFPCSAQLPSISPSSHSSCVTVSTRRTTVLPACLCAPQGQGPGSRSSLCPSWYSVYCQIADTEYVSVEGWMAFYSNIQRFLKIFLNGITKLRVNSTFGF